MGMILADHETLWEAGRITPAILVAIALTALAAAFVLHQARRNRRWLSASAGRVAAAGLVLVVIAAAMGIVPREAAGGSAICGPVLFEPIPAEGEACGSVMAGPTTIFAITAVGGLALLAASEVLRRRQSEVVDTPPPGTSRYAS